jgi:hypothetical protein
MVISRLLRRQRPPAALRDLRDETTHDTDTGAVRSVQSAEVVLPQRALQEVWSAANLERLARTYWRFLARVTLGVVYVRYTERERSVVFLLPAVKLITFAEPEYEMDAEHGVVRWRIESGLLVAHKRRIASRAGVVSAGGHLQIEVRRLRGQPPEVPMGGAPDPPARLRIVVEVANFYPAIAFALSRRLYDITQSRIHVLVTRAFLRSLVRGSSEQGVPDLAVSKVGRLSPELGAPVQAVDSEPGAAQASEPGAAQAS